MIQVADLVASLRAEDSSFSPSMDAAERAVEGLKHSTDSTLGSLKTLGLGLGALSAGALVGAIKAASDFQTTLIHVQANTGITDAQVGQMSEGIKRLAASSGAPLDQLSEGFMRIHNSGFSATDALKLLTPAMQSALSTGDDVGKVAAALGVAMHEFNINVAQGAVTMNVLHTAAQLGNSTLGEFVDGTTRAFNVAGGFGVQLVDVAAALATLTQSGQTARAASDGLTSVMFGIVKPTAAATAAIQNINNETGVNLANDFSAAGLKARGLTNVIEDVRTAVTKMGGETSVQRKTLSDYADTLDKQGVTGDKWVAAMQKMARSIHDPTAALITLFPNVRAFREMMLLTGSQADAFSKSQSTLADVMSGKLDPTLTGFNKQQASLAGIMQKLQMNVELVGISLGTALLPPVTALAQAVLPIVQSFSDWAQQNQQLVVGILLVGAAIGGVTVASIGLATAVEVMLGPIGLLAAAGAAVYVAWRTNFMGIQGLVQETWNNVRPVVDQLRRAFDLGGVGGVAQWLRGQVPAVEGELGRLSSAVLSWAGRMAPEFLQRLRGWGQALVEWVSPKIGPLIAELGTLLSRVGSWVLNDALPYIAVRLKGWGNALVDWVAPKVGPLLSASGALLSAFGAWVVGPASSFVWEKVQEWGKRFVDWVSPRLGPLLSAAGDLLGRFGNWITGPAANAIGQKLSEWGNKFVAWVVPAMTEFLRDWPGHLNDFLKVIHDNAETIAKRLAAWAGAFVNWVVANDVPAKLLKAFVAVNAALVYFIGTTVAVIAKNLGMWALEFWNWLDPGDTFAKLGPSFHKLVDSIGGWIRANAMNDIKSALGSWVDAFKGWVADVWPKLKTELQSLLSTIVAWVKGDMANALKSAATDVGKSIIQGAKDGITSLGGSLKDHTVGVFSSAFDGVRNFHISRSPSRLYHDHATDVLQGFINGLDDKRNDVVAHMGGVAKAASQGFMGTMMAGIGSAANETILTWGQKLEAGAPSIKAAVADVWLQAWQPETLVGDVQAAWASADVGGLMTGVITKGLGGESWGGTFAESWGSTFAKAGTTAVAKASPTVTQAFSGTAKSMITAFSQEVDHYQSLGVAAVNRLVAALTTAGHALDGNFASIAATASQRLANLVRTGNINGVVAGQQAKVVSPYDAAGSLTPSAHNNATAQIVADMVAGTTAATQLSSLIRGLGLNESQQITTIAQLRLNYGQISLRLNEQIAAAQKAGHTSEVQQLKDERAVLDDNYKNALLKLEALSQNQQKYHQQAVQASRVAASSTAANNAAGTAANAQLNLNFTNDRVGQERLIAAVKAQYASDHQHQLDAISELNRKYNANLLEDQRRLAEDLRSKNAKAVADDRVRIANLRSNHQTQLTQLTDEEHARTIAYQQQLRQLNDVLVAMAQGHALTMAQIAEEAAARKAAFAAANAATVSSSTVGGPGSNLSGAGVTVGSLTAGAAAAANPLQQAIADATKVAPDAMKKFGTLMANLLAAGLAQGLGEQGAITYALRTLSQGMQQQFTQDWDMHSPSRIAESYGRNIVAGLVGGIRASHAEAQAALGGLALGGGSTSGGSAGDVHVTVNVSGDGVTVDGVDHHGLGKAVGDVARAFLAAAKTTAPPRNRLLPGAFATVAR